MVSKKKSKENVRQNNTTRQDDYMAGQQHKIALAAYYKAENRGFVPGHEFGYKHAGSYL